MEDNNRKKRDELERKIKKMEQEIKDNNEEMDRRLQDQA